MTVRKIFNRFCNIIRHFSNEINKRGGRIFFCGGWNFSKSVSVDSTFIIEMRVCEVFSLRPVYGLKLQIKPHPTRCHYPLMTYLKVFSNFEQFFP